MTLRYWTMRFLAACFFLVSPTVPMAFADSHGDGDHAEHDKADPASNDTGTDDTGTKDEKKEKSFPEPRNDCMSVRILNNYRVIDRRHAIFFEGRNRPYLVTFAASCFGLRGSVGIKAASRTGRICGGAGERLIVGRGSSAERCLIRSVERVESDDHARYLVEQRTGKDQKKNKNKDNSNDG